MFVRTRISAATAGFLTLATSVGIVLAGGGIASAATPPYEPDPNAVGTLNFYDASGNQITSGSINDHPIAAYVVGSATVRAGDVQAALFEAQPNPAVSNPALWNLDQPSGFTAYPLTTGPANIQSLSQTHPVVKGAATDLSAADFIAEFPNTSGTLANLYQYRIKTATSAGSQTTAYLSGDILVSGTTWTQVYPTAAAATTTTLVAAPSPASVGQTVTLTATVTPSGTAGSVQFMDGATNLASPVAVNGSGVATTSTSSLTQATHSLSAVFTPTSSSFAGSTGSFSEVVNPAATPTTTGLAVTQDGVAGHDVALTATVAPSAAAGTVAFYDNGSSTAIPGTVTNPTAGSFVLDLPAGLTAGSHSVVAKFSPTSVTAFQASQSTPQSFVLQAPQQGACLNTGSVCTDVQNIVATVGTGTLVISTPYSATSPLDLGTLALDSTGTKLVGAATFDHITVTDNRPGNLPYTVAAVATALSDGGSHAGSTIDSKYLGLTNLVSTPGTGFTGVVTPTNNPAADPGNPADTNTGLGGAPHTVFAVDHGLGSVGVLGTVTLQAPTSTEAGLFAGTITFTVG